MSVTPDTKLWPRIEVGASPQRLAAFEAANGVAKLDALIKEAVRIAQGKESWLDKSEALMTVAERASELIVPFTPCTKGCNHCCYMATAVSSFEADMIGRYLGRNPATVNAVPITEYDDEAAKVEEYTGVRCTLLGEDGKCTVYPVRPVACRLHHNIAEDESNCQIAGIDKSKGLCTTPAINTMELTGAFAYVAVMANHKFADIRDWFPKKEAT